jgi:signal peptidase I
MRSGRRIISTVVGVAVAGVSWLALAPRQLGGQFQMLTVAGASMEPSLHAGDLVFVRARSAYEVGDVLAYRAELVDAVLLHRVVEIDDSGLFTLRGDANDDLDVDHPSADAVIGGTVLRIPGGARVLRALASPFVIAGALGLAVLFTRVRRVRARATSRKRSIIMQRTTVRNRAVAAASAPSAPVAAALLVIVALGATGIGAAAAMAPSVAGTDGTYAHRGTFSYDAPGPRTVYQDGHATAGEEIFLKVSSYADVSFSYSFVTEATAEIDGRIALRALLTDASGWSRSMTLVPETPFAGTQGRITGTLDLSKVRRMLNRFEQATGAQRVVYQILLQPAVELVGEIDGAAYQEAFTPTLALEHDGTVLRYAVQPDAEVDPLRPSSQGSVPGASGRGERVLSIAGRSVAAQPVAIAMALIALLAAMLAGGIVHLSRAAAALDAAARIRARFADRLVVLGRLPELPTIVVDSAQGFERLAAASDEPILEHTDRYGITWLLAAADTTYSFHLATDSGGGLITPDAEFTRFLAAETE